MVRVLVGCENLAAIAIVIAEVRLDEAVLGESILFAIRKEILDQSEQFRLILEEIDHFQRRALRIKIVELRRVTGIYHALIDACVANVQIKQVHADLAERSTVVGKSTIAKGRPGDRRKPAVKHRIVSCEASEDRDLFG